MTVLPAHGQSYPLKISLKLIAEIEDNYGSVYQLAEKLLDKSLSLTSIIGVLKILYRHVGCEMTEDLILQQPGTELLASVLLDILGPIERLGAVLPGEPLTAQKDESI